MDETFMNDVNATTIEGMLSAYDAGSTFGGAGTGQVSVNQPGDHGSNPGIYIRGRTTTPQLDGLQLNNGNYGDTSFGSTSSTSNEPNRTIPRLRTRTSSPRGRTRRRFIT